MATHSSILAWRIPGMGEPGGLPSMGLHRLRHNWSDLAAAAAAAWATEPPRRPSVGEWVSKLWSTLAAQYYSAPERNDLSSHEKTWSNLTDVLLGKRSQSEKATPCTIPIIWHSGKSKTTETMKRSLVVKGSEGERWTGRSQRIFRAVKIFCIIR